MKDFKSTKGKQLFSKDNEEIAIDGQFIYLNLSVGNMSDFANTAKNINTEDECAVFELAKLMFTQESYELVKFLDPEDFMMVLDCAIDTLEKEKNKLESNFKRADV